MEAFASTCTLTICKIPVHIAPLSTTFALLTVLLKDSEDTAEEEPNGLFVQDSPQDSAIP